MSNLTVEQIEATIQAEYSKYYNSPFLLEDGTQLPSDLTDIFKTAIKKISPQLHQVYAKKIREIINKRLEDLTFLEVGMMVNVILGIELERLYPNLELEEMLDKHEYFEKIQISYNKQVDDLNIRLKSRKLSLMEIGGFTKNTHRLSTVK